MSPLAAILHVLAPETAELALKRAVETWPRFNGAHLDDVLDIIGQEDGFLALRETHFEIEPAFETIGTAELHGYAQIVAVLLTDYHEMAADPAIRWDILPPNYATYAAAIAAAATCAGVSAHQTIRHLPSARTT
jgi:hypothetical protein